MEVIPTSTLTDKGLDELKRYIAKGKHIVFWVHPALENLP